MGRPTRARSVRPAPRSGARPDCSPLRHPHSPVKSSRYGTWRTHLRDRRAACRLRRRADRYPCLPPLSVVLLAARLLHLRRCTNLAPTALGPAAIDLDFAPPRCPSVSSTSHLLNTGWHRAGGRGARPAALERGCWVGLGGRGQPTRGGTRETKGAVVLWSLVALEKHDGAGRLAGRSKVVRFGWPGPLLARRVSPPGCPGSCCSHGPQPPTSPSTRPPPAPSPARSLQDGR